MEDTKKKNSIHDLLLTGFFLLALFAVPVMLLCTKDKTFSDAERRYLTERPSLSQAELRDWHFDDDFEEYLADQMPLRNAFVGINSYFTRLTGRTVAANVYRDADGHLVEAPASMSADELTRRLNRIQALGEKTGLTPKIVAVPAAGYIRRDKLPPSLAALYRDGALLTRLNETEGVLAVPLEETFLREGPDYYYRTDHHWNREGAYAGYTLLCAALDKDPLLLGQYITRPVPGFSGSTVSRSALWLTAPETLYLYEPDTPVTVTFSDDEKTYSSLLFTDHIGEYDWYPAFIDGNHPLTFIRNGSSPNSETLVMIKDSFGNTLAPFLVPMYRTVILADPRYYRGSISDICSEYGASELVFCYSLERLATDTNLLLIK